MLKRDDSEIEVLEQELRRDPILKLAGLIKALVGMCAGCIVAIVGGALWVANQTNAIAANTADVRSIIEDRKAGLKEWNAWKAVKDENDTKIFIIIENQQKLIESQQRLIERIDARMKQQ